VRRGLADGSWRPRPQTWRRGTACVGVFTLLFQAMLFAWHSHPLPVSPRNVAAAVSAFPATGHGASGLEDDDCQICFALSHHSAAPIDFLLPSPPREAASSATRVEENLARLARYLQFRSRAPPSRLKAASTT